MPVAPTPVQPVKPVPPLVRIESHYRKFLTTRWIGLVVRSAIVTTAALFIVPGVLICWNYTLLSGTATLLVGPLVYLFSTHLVLLARRSWIVSPPVLPARASPLGVLYGTFTARTVRLLFTYFVFGLVFALAYTTALNARAPQVDLAWLRPTSRYPWHGNERLWFLVQGNTMFFVGLGLRDVLHARLGPVWPRNRLRFPDAVRRSLVACFSGYRSEMTFLHDASVALSFTLAYSFVYFTFRVWAWRFTVTHLAIVRPYVFNYVRSSRSNVTWSLAYHLLVLQLTGLLALKPAVAVVNDYLTQPLHFASFTNKSPLSPDRYLLTALQSKNAFYNDHTVAELQRLAHYPPRRKALFGEVSPALVHEMWTALLIQIGQAHHTIATRGAPPKKAAMPQATVTPLLPDERTLTPKAVDIFRPAPPKKGLQAIVTAALDGAPRPTPAPVVAVATRAREAEVAAVADVEKRTHAVEQWAAGTPILGPVVTAAHLARGGFVRWAGAEWARRKVQAAVPEPDRLAAVVDTLTTLAVASATEDTYGHVQVLLPATLEAFVRTRAAALGLGNELLGQAPTVAPDADADVRADIARITGIFDRALLRIVDCFGSSLTAFRFPADVAAQLTDICRQ